ncbi:hypothetical protein NQ317_010463 [Molorchus minor]|uniref:Uncharacterized protein n=1 Tax=Molorchus minor TaxID=1323400 RepID=A0ABQ9K005_9CUCU|nr:hypothetical protein NQ317_010463 [Molorchus minor]
MVRGDGFRGRRPFPYPPPGYASGRLLNRVPVPPTVPTPLMALSVKTSRLSTGGPPAHMLQFSPLFYPYQLAMAQAAATGKSNNANIAELQRAADLQRQYLLDMIPGPQQRHNWKT